ncbi:MAG: HAD-IA family hydrolase [Candidatus Latescibacteria bacterium]|nr:HAD-IA family hydrolase [Candidatus Latescibacterota bacterium]
MIRAVIFDLDNTLIDFMRMKDEAVRAAADAMVDAGLDMSRVEIVEGIEEVYREKGIEYQKVFDDFLERKTGGINWKILASGVLAYRRSREAHLVLYPHAHETLVKLAKKGIRLAVVTDAPRREAWLRLVKLGLHHLFDVVVTFEDTGKLKPDSAPFMRALDLLAVEAGETLMVGDWVERDMVGAGKLGIRTAFARYGDIFSSQESGADYEIDDIAELINIVER